jgi:predicted CXXCH cytochrome family protein
VRTLRKLIFITVIFAILGLVTVPAYSADQTQCISCHVKCKERAKSVHAALALGCASCHESVAGMTHPGQKGSVRLIQPMPGLCYTCHDEANFKGKYLHTPVTTGMCTACHDAHQSDYNKVLLKDQPGLCFDCHKETKFKGRSVHAPVGGGLCTGCHNPHASNSENILLSDVPEVCYTCHDKALFTKKNVHAVVSMPNGCNLCHNPHASDTKPILLQAIDPLCISCHSTKTDGRHIVSLPGKNKIHPLQGAKDPLFPGTKKIPDPFNPAKELEVPDPDNPGRDINCVTCHNPHSTDFTKLFPQRNICARCHTFY